MKQHIDVEYFVAEAARIIYEICNAIVFLHTMDIAHRDLKVGIVFVVQRRIFIASFLRYVDSVLDRQCLDKYQSSVPS